MNDRLARELRLRGETERRAEAELLLERPGDAVLVRRGLMRSLLLRCPDGCGETLQVNLDRRAGKAWRLRFDRGGLTLYPSVWRDGGCGSHFVVWQHRILWCGAGRAREGDEPPYDPGVEARLARALRADLLSAEELGTRIDESGWEVSRAGTRLVLSGAARRGEGDRSDWFGLAEESRMSG